jgi:hypothetical protein
MQMERWLDLFPPYLIRLIARSGVRGHPLTSRDIAFRADRSIRWVAEMSKRTSWDKVPFRDLKDFLYATGTTERGFPREREFVLRSVAGTTRRMMTHIDQLPPAERRFLDGLSGSRSRDIADRVKAMLASKQEP